MKYTSVPGPKHVMVQAFLSVWIKQLCPRGWHVDVKSEYKFENEPIRSDLFVTYRKHMQQFKVLYEVQRDLGDKQFDDKIKTITGKIRSGEYLRDKFGSHRIDELIVIPTDNISNDCFEAYKQTKDWIILP